MDKMMRAIVKAKAAEGLVEESLPIPTPGPGEVRIRTLRTSICGTDIHIYNWDAWAQQTMKPPVTIGHEFSGVIDALGEGVHSVYVGQRVSGEGHITCGVCRNCRQGQRHLCANTLGLGIHINGCFSEYFCVPSRNVFVLPDDISDDIACIMDPFGNAVHTVLSYPVVSEDVLITGAGPIGLMATMVAKAAGARSVTVTDVSPARLELASALGATTVLNVEKIPLESILPEIGVPDGFGTAFEMSGSPDALASIVKTMRRGGNVALLGLLPDQSPMNWTNVIFKSLSIRGIYGRKIFETWYQMVGLLQSGLDLSPIITQEWKVQDWEKGFTAMRGGDCGKVVLDWT